MKTQSSFCAHVCNLSVWPFCMPVSTVCFPNSRRHLDENLQIQSKENTLIKLGQVQTWMTFHLSTQPQLTSSVSLFCPISSLRKKSSNGFWCQSSWQVIAIKASGLTLQYTVWFTATLLRGTIFKILPILITPFLHSSLMQLNATCWWVGAVVWDIQAKHQLLSRT